MALNVKLWVRRATGVGLARTNARATEVSLVARCDYKRTNVSGSGMISRIRKLYHLAEASNLPSILEHGLMSTERLLYAAGVPNSERAARLCSHRAHNVRVSERVLIRDQRPMPPSALA